MTTPHPDERKANPFATPNTRISFGMAAAETVRRRVREGIFEVTHAGDVGQQLEAIEGAVLEALTDRKIAWALAYLAGVQMAPELIRALAYPAAEAQPAPPPLADRRG